MIIREMGNGVKVLVDGKEVHNVCITGEPVKWRIDVEHSVDEEDKSDGVLIGIGAGGKGCSITTFTTITELFREWYGDKTVNQEQFNSIVEKLGEVEDLYQSLPKKERGD